MERLGIYELISPIGQGGMAEVLLARRALAGGPGKLVAIKRMAAGLAEQPHYREMFEAETRMSMTLSHSNIVQVFDCSTEPGNAYIVMEFVDGVDLGTLIAHAKESGQVLPLPVATFVVGELLRALSYSHNLNASSASLGVIHRDVSPQNLLISKAGEVKLTDFGVARLVDENTSGAQPKGKLRYMAPEQMSGKKMDSRVDLFAVGAILFELLCGRHYRNAEAIDQLYGQILNPEAVQMPESVPQELRELTIALLAQDAEERIPTAREALKRLQASESYVDARDDLARLVNELRPDALELPPPSAPRVPAHDPPMAPPGLSSSGYAGGTAVIPRHPPPQAPPASAAMDAGTIADSIPEGSTLPDQSLVEDTFVAGKLRTLPMVLGGVALLSVLGIGTGWLLSESSRASEEEMSLRNAGLTPKNAKLLPREAADGAQRPALGNPGEGPALGSPSPAADGSPKLKKAASEVSAKTPKPAGAGKNPALELKGKKSANRAAGKNLAGLGSKKPRKAQGSGDRAEGAATHDAAPIPSNDRPAKASDDPQLTNKSRKGKKLSRAERRRLRLERKRLREEEKARRNERLQEERRKKQVVLNFKAHELDFAYVRVGKRELVIEPLGRMTVMPGVHRVEVREAPRDPWRTFGQLRVVAGERVEIRLRRSGSLRISRRRPPN